MDRRLHHLYAHRVIIAQIPRLVLHNMWHSQPPSFRTKSVFYTKKVKWCARIIDEEGYQLGLRNIEAFRTMVAPITAVEFCQFILGCRWMSNCTPDFHRKLKPLDEILEKSCENARKWKKSALKNISLHKLSWCTEHKNSLAPL